MSSFPGSYPVVPLELSLPVQLDRNFTQKHLERYWLTSKFSYNILPRVCLLTKYVPGSGSKVNS
jgi:hypothetical protein